MFWEENKKFCQHSAIVDTISGVTFSYDELHTFVDKIIPCIPSDSKKLVLLMTDNSVTSVALYLAMLKLDFAIMLTDSNSDINMLRTIIENYKPHLIVGKLSNAFDGFETKTVQLDQFSFEVAKSLSEELPDLYTELSVMLSTSGSTGSSKFVKLTKTNILANARSIIEYLGIDEHQKAITTLPMHYSFGLSIINSHLLAGATLVCTNNSVVQKEFWDSFREHQCTSFSGVPYTYQILEKFRFNRMKLPSLQYYTQAGGHLNSETKKYFLDYATQERKKFIVMYGQTEATARISYVPFEKLGGKLESIGIAIPGGQLRIFDDNSEITEPNRIGELIYEGSNVMLGYATSYLSLKEGDELKGVLKTGDLGKFDEDGFFYVTGRMKRFLKVFGNRISLDDLERMLEVQYKLPFAVTGIDDLICILGENFDQSDKLISSLADRLGLHFSAFKFLSCTKLPISTNGKKDYGEIKGMFL